MNNAPNNNPAGISLFKLPKYTCNYYAKTGTPFTTYEVCARLAPGEQVVIYTTNNRAKAAEVLAALNA